MHWALQKHTNQKKNNNNIHSNAYKWATCTQHIRTQQETLALISTRNVCVAAANQNIKLAVVFAAYKSKQNFNQTHSFSNMGEWERSEAERNGCVGATAAKSAKKLMCLDGGKKDVECVHDECWCYARSSHKQYTIHIHTYSPSKIVSSPYKLIHIHTLQCFRVCSECYNMNYSGFFLRMLGIY